ncbi:QueT transporter family protein [Clostridium sp. AN503]|uniref:QueT transporter family protein n=1 Tax=Clostridium sp. AN503 TaxID=3160598 RepID=UPI003457F7CD
MRESKNKVQFMTQSAMIAAIYTALTVAFAPVAYGPVQFRISEALCVLPFFTPAAIPGLFLGCAISNGIGVALGTAVLPDVVFGSLATLIGALGSYAVRKNRWLVCIPPIAANTIIIPWVLRYAYGAPDLIPVMMVTVGIGEILAVGVLGNFLLAALERYKGLIFKKIFVG